MRWCRREANSIYRGCTHFRSCSGAAVIESECRHSPDTYGEIFSAAAGPAAADSGRRFHAILAAHRADTARSLHLFIVEA